jgi:crotonobetainyl-CoA hydratase
MELLLTGRRMGADEAMRWGLVRSVAPRDRLMDEARELADRIAAAAPLATRATKQVVRGSEGLSAQEAFAAMSRGEFPAYGRALESAETLEGARAFEERRPPRFT